MKIAKALFVSPDHNFWYGLVAVAISVFVFAYSTRFGQVSVLVYYALWLPLILIDYRHTLGNYAKFYWIIAFGVLACLSTFWSAAPACHRAGRRAISVAHRLRADRRAHHEYQDDVARHAGRRLPRGAFFAGLRRLSL